MAFPVATKFLQLPQIHRPTFFVVTQRLASTSGTGGTENNSSKKKSPKAPTATATPPPQSPPINTNVSGATEGYKVKEYFEHNPYSFYDLNAQMDKMRMPQPSSRK